MEQKAVIDYFDRAAAHWDAELIRNDRVISAILDGAEVAPGKDVLDVACGTGVLFPDYAARRVGSLTAIDISPEMVQIARSKLPGGTVLCGDAQIFPFSRRFDCIVIYNAFPHFPDPRGLLAHLAGQLKPGGTLTVAHGMSRAAIDRHHSGSAAQISVGLMDAESLAGLFRSVGLSVCVLRSDDTMYQVTGRKE